MAQFDANINLNVNNREALKGVTQVEGGINKLIKGVKEFERVFNDALNPKIQNRFQLEQERKALTLFKQQNEALTNQFRLAAKLGSAYDKLQVKIVGSELVRAEKARNAQKALPGGSIGQKALPASTSGKSIALQRAQDDAIAAEANLRSEMAEEAARQLRVDKAITDAKVKLERAAEGEVSQTVRTGEARKRGETEPFIQQPKTSSSKYQQKLQAEVDRQIRVTGKLSNELLETVAKYNKVQTSADRLIKTQGRLSTELVKETKKKGGRGGGGGAGGGLAAGIGFPLLFGGGPGSVIGGAVGSAGGFGTQILASAIGGIIDQTVAKIAKLGQALNPLTADIDAVIAAAGESSTAFGQLVKDLEKVAGKEAALAAATAQLATVIGTSGVTALRQFGAETTDLGNEVSEALSLASSAVAEFVNQTGLLAALINGIDTANLKKAADRNTTDPELQRLKEARANISPDTANPTFSIAGITIATDLEDQIDAADAAIVARQRALQVEEQLNIKTQAGIELAETKAATSNVALNLVKAEIALAESGLDLTTSAGVALAEKVIEQKTYVALQAAINQGLSTEVIQQQEVLEKLQLKARAAAAVEAANRKAEAAARKAANEAKRLAREAEQAAKKELRVKQTLAQLDIQDYNLAIQQIQATQGELAAIKEQQKNLDALLAKKIKIIELSGKDQRIQDKEILVAKEQIKLDRITLANKLREIVLQEELNRLKREQQLDAVQTGLDQELAGLTVGENDNTKLLREQGDRYANTLKEINNQIEAQQLLVDNTPSPNQEAFLAATAQLDVLKKTKGAYEAMLPQIFAAEQAQLKYNQAFAAINPAVNSLVSGLRDVVAGTKTAEEAFADFLNTVADQLIQTAATMIAQYIAIGIAKAFAFGGNSPIRGASPSALTGAGASMANMLMPPGKATGGTADGGQPYIVGESGPELFIPGVTGTVTSNDQFEAARNAMSGGSSPGADGSVSSDSAGVSSAFAENTSSITTTNSYMRERSMERSSQTTVGGGGSLVVETQVINNVEYATVEQMQLASAASAKQARAEVFRDLRNKPAARASVGMR